ncbi:hypothetical protein WAK64_02455 [Bacillus spongiae]|uniref:Uncharacterized protein n=1 Tax=Bacillus spongiae TaxID=2683610 RepID=A0ABU8H9G7_9BACI
MYVVSTFASSLIVEPLLLEVQEENILLEDILVLPLESHLTHIPNEKVPTEKGYIDFGAIFGAICMLLGVIYGFKVTIGPILLALVGLIVGGVLGALIYHVKKKKIGKIKESCSEILIMIHCQKHQSHQIISILECYAPLSISHID